MVLMSKQSRAALLAIVAFFIGAAALLAISF
jgi:hypothetical protein